MNASVETIDKTPGRIDLLLRKLILNKLSQIEQARITIQDDLGVSTLGNGSKQDLHAHIEVLDLDFYIQAALFGSIGTAEAYMQQLWQTDDLTGLVRIMVRNRDLLDSMEGGPAMLANKLLRLWHLSKRNTTSGSKKNISAHYDLGNDLFDLFLDHHGMYSSATFYHPDNTLDQASTDKLERICQKLHLSESDHVLEIGTGWGGFAAYAARNYGCKITTTTISKEQFQTAVQRMHEQGVVDRVNVIMEDYRDLAGCYDKLVSIEMIEAVGHQYLDTYINQCSSLLKPNGLALIQAITIEDWRYQQALKSVDFIQRYIFPGSFIPSVSAILNSAAKSSNLRLINLEDQGPSYALTLQHWRQNFMSNLEQVRALGYSEEFIRMWEFYLCYCEGGFKEKSISSAQLLFAKPENNRNQWLPV